MKFSRHVFFLLIFAFSGGHVLAQQCDSKAYPSTPTSQFTEGKPGTVTDSKTNLTWMRCPIGMHWKERGCADVAVTHEWKDAYREIARLNKQGGYAGHADWRLPSLEELQSLVERRCYDPAINMEVFPATPPSGFWSSTPDADYANGAWLVYFRHGESYMGNTQQAWLMRLVRGGK